MPKHKKSMNHYIIEKKPENKPAEKESIFKLRHLLMIAWIIFLGVSNYQEAHVGDNHSIIIQAVQVASENVGDFSEQVAGITALSDFPTSLCSESPSCSLTSGYVIYGRKYNSRTGDATTGEGLMGWVITATDGTNEYTTTTDSEGYYCFENLPSGEYTVSEQMQEGWEPETPASVDNINLDYTAGSCNVNGADFGNMIPSPPPTRGSGGGSGRRKSKDECSSGEVKCSTKTTRAECAYDIQYGGWTWREYTCAENEQCSNGMCVCIDDWVCDEWSACVDGIRTRECYDANHCGRLFPETEEETCKDIPPEEPTGDLRTIGFWKHQFEIATGRSSGHAQIESQELSGLADYCDETLSSGYELLWGEEITMDIEARMIQQCLGTCLNEANNAVDDDYPVDIDYDKVVDTTYENAMTIVYNYREIGNYEAAKDICDSINNMGSKDEIGEEETGLDVEAGREEKALVEETAASAIAQYLDAAAAGLETASPVIIYLAIAAAYILAIVYIGGKFVMRKWMSHRWSIVNYALLMFAALASLLYKIGFNQDFPMALSLITINMAATIAADIYASKSGLNAILAIDKSRNAISQSVKSLGRINRRMSLKAKKTEKILKKMKKSLKK